MDLMRLHFSKPQLRYNKAIHIFYIFTMLLTNRKKISSHDYFT